jgi:hypothetical protein
MLNSEAISLSEAINKARVKKGVGKYTKWISTPLALRETLYIKSKTPISFNYTF